jgi:hypothetical protein
VHLGRLFLVVIEADHGRKELVGYDVQRRHLIGGN